MFDFEYQLKILPDKPGVYLMKNSLGEIIYIGKAKILKNRVRQYFQNSKNHSEKVRAMVKNIYEFEYIVTDSEMEALILECNLIKKYRPRYNILLKDDKGYPFIKITVNEDFPRVFVTRTVAKDGSKYFGPYTDSGAVYETIELIKTIFPIRTCRKLIKEDGEKIRPCLNYHIGLCKAPCGGYIAKNQYMNIIKDVMELLNGKSKNIVENLRKQMEEAAEDLEFEKAANIRDKIVAVEKITEKQKIITRNFENEDFISIYSDEKDSCAQIFFLREGKIVGREHFIIENTVGMEEANIICDFIKSFYGGTAFIPKSIYVSSMEDIELIEKWLTMKRGSKVWIKIPKKGEKKDTLDLVKKNAKFTLEQFKLKILQDKEIHQVALRELAEVLGLEEIPMRIEAYDISNIQGVDSVGSMVVFENGKSKNSDYRRFKINSVKGANDYDSMREILNRRFKHGLMEIKDIQERNLTLSSGKFCVFPDLILMDGGKGQVNIALEVLKSFNINIPVCGMVKDSNHNTRGIIYNNNELSIPFNSNVMRLITRIQDEVHRFAISYHRSLRDKRVLHSILEDIPHIGNKRRKELLKKFGSIEKIKNASYEELLHTPSIDKKAALSILEFFKEK
ncbi:excinuclease ABC subunit C [Clostridium tetanomorphum]|uniref:UvrABC system protein C n=1 Tax=Clostridium tetanomorphum TaxID=1553 RepID=A0A923E9C2_CLOTT|nr:excinuclease ABC subunit UvrC [Clostridium tetanomorphum]KAJ49411.1 excinuclease ABC subunit C [Clostridium tetanomorphum DSM 665]KAJ53200.1 excinuclease ABC subunit C [Clostridium tetanomorphum DSM 665]MBC2397506.1 excinuclease ABC subunit UvrC [Clostridium tetanomorphum]MBP1863602.1 excinuclease ABC subunit C [Clostridium tetanomorphum]NRS86178.1 excinuclease ABC subunit C [Clostridium tetanomorphum]